MTAVQYIENELVKRNIFIPISCEEIFSKAKEIEEKNIADAMMHALDEDGHTGFWKNEFIENYISNINNGKSNTQDKGVHRQEWQEG